LLIRALLGAGVLLVANGCHSMARVSKPIVADYDAVEIRFNPWRDITARAPDGSPILLSAVSKARGTVARVKGDTITVLLGSWRGEFPPADHDLESGTEAWFSASDSALTFHRNRFSPIKSLVLLGSVVGMFALAVGQASVAGH
jgi:hypothetical protein